MGNRAHVKDRVLIRLNMHQSATDRYGQLILQLVGDFGNGCRETIIDFLTKTGTTYYRASFWVFLSSICSLLQHTFGAHHFCIQIQAQTNQENDGGEHQRKRIAHHFHTIRQNIVMKGRDGHGYK